VLDAARAAGCGRLAVVIGHRAECIRRTFDGARDLRWVLQERQLGTGHALAQAEGEVPEDALLLVLSGDVPLVHPETLRSLIAAAREGWGAMAVAEPDEPGALGRVVRRAGRPDVLERIVEASDASADELAIRTVNAGLYALPAGGFFPYLQRLGTDNAQGELYLTDALGAAAADGHPVRLVRLEDPDEALGVNTPAELERVDRILRERTPVA
jgi:bifunctional UDP-N-acetylglucosamine pyrophosphorylase/glucosamine-1-phosphate N-acetyltransferase